MEVIDVAANHNISAQSEQQYEREQEEEEGVSPGDKNKIENICVTAIFCPTGNFSKFPKLCLVSCMWCLIGTKAGIIRESREYFSD